MNENFDNAHSGKLFAFLGRCRFKCLVLFFRDNPLMTVVNNYIVGLLSFPRHPPYDYV